MGKYEDQLKAMGTADAEWRVEEFNALEAQMTQLKRDMKTISKNPGWTGASADAASALFTTLTDDFAAAEAKLAAAKLAIGHANTVRREAAKKTSTLPDAGVPDWVHTAALVGGSVLVPVPGIGTFAAEYVVQRVNEYMGKQREAAAYQALETMQSDLGAPTQELQNASLGITWPTSAPVPSPDFPGDGVVYDGDDTGAGAWRTGGTGTGSGGGGGGTDITDPPYPYPVEPPVIYDPPPYPPVVLPPVHPEGWPDNVIVRPPTVSIDGNVGSGTTGGFSGGGGLGAGLLGAGVVGGGIGAAKLASKSGLGGAGGLFGPNGILGGGAGGANVAGAGAGVGGAGAKGSGTGMMGGGQGGGGSSEKDKRTSLGLMAPKLEDDEETGPRSAAAGAGGRE